MRHLLTVAVPPGQLAKVLAALEPTGTTVLTIDPPEPTAKWTARVLLEWVDGPCTEQEARESLGEDLETLHRVLDAQLVRLTVNDELSLETLEPLTEDPDAPALVEWRARLKE